MTKVREKKKNLVVMDRDASILYELYVHRTMTCSQLSRLCFGESSYETARKRIRRLAEAGLIGLASSERSEQRGRPELMYFLTNYGARVLEKKRVIAVDEVPTGPPHTYHKERYLELVDIRLSLEEAQRQGKINRLSWLPGNQFAEHWANNHRIALSESPDAAITFAYPRSEPIMVLLEVDSGNFRQTKHWEPKIKNFLMTGRPIWVVAGSLQRIDTLCQWTLPLVAEAGMGPGKIVFAVFDELEEKGIFAATWRRVDGTVSDLKPR